MTVDQYLTDDQDPKTAEKVLGKLRDMLTSGEAVIYLAIQKKPAVTLTPDCIALTNKRIIFCLPGNLGFTTDFGLFLWADIKEVSFKEEFFGSKFTVVPLSGENITIDYIPKIQARKLYQLSNEQLERMKEAARQHELEEKRVSQPVFPATPAATPPAAELPEEDELTAKLQKLKGLYERGLISQEEYESKKADLLSRF
jgi:hypothetical protein